MKNKFMRIAAVMLMLCLVTTCAISGTFAKYTTEASGEDTARVAYWGWTGTTLTIDELFADTYDNVTTSVTNENLIAPGTTNSETFTITYTDGKANSGADIEAPEVAYKFVVSTTGSVCDATIQSNTNIKWSLICKETGVADNAIVNEGTWTQLLSAIDALSQATVNANALPGSFDNGQVYEVKWVWDFEDADDAGTTDKNETAIQDKIDTDMGNAADLADVKIVISISATQID